MRSIYAICEYDNHNHVILILILMVDVDGNQIFAESLAKSREALGVRIGRRASNAQN
jgi:hypothetical protein